MAYVSAFYETGPTITVKALIHNADMEFADVVAEAFETYAAGSIGDYDITCGELGNTGEYYFAWPSGAWMVAGRYVVQFVPLAGANIAESDLLNRFGVGTWYWDGTNLTPIKMTDIESILADTNELQTDWVEGGRLDAKLDTASAPTVEQIDAELSSSHGSGRWTTGGDSGTGANVVTITVNDGTDLLEDAKVRMTKGALSYIVSTNVSGVAAFALDDGTWIVSITLVNHTFTTTTLVVDGTETQTYSMTASTIPSSDADKVTGYSYCYDEDGVIEAGATIEIRFKNIVGTGGYFDRKIRTETSDANGLVSFTNLFAGATYEIRRELNGIWTEIEIDDDASSPVALESVWGEDDG